MRHQHRHGHRAQYAAGHAPKHEFAQARVAVAAHHDEIDALIGRTGKQHVGNIDVVAKRDALHRLR